MTDEKKEPNVTAIKVKMSGVGVVTPPAPEEEGEK